MFAFWRLEGEAFELYDHDGLKPYHNNLNYIYIYICEYFRLSYVLLAVPTLTIFWLIWFLDHLLKAKVNLGLPILDLLPRHVER